MLDRELLIHRLTTALAGAEDLLHDQLSGSPFDRDGERHYGVRATKGDLLLLLIEVAAQTAKELSAALSGGVVAEAAE
ncbi:hypothetical protein [Ancylobacter sp. SL191]|uniref:hypothetical protein n=1 Tax=Ancylobacter sp. SL191 TaxID=2995166 RepID=UPI0022718EB9|nr:hypothetical protein [Ancylobacter sp. SL191]WAC26262.1 hypothetical protein OU996_14740 [Ancylobacter sp. SL191]